MKTVLITGGTRGIGKEIARTFAKNGYQVAFTYKKSENEAKILAEELGALAIRADSALQDEVVSAVALVEKEYGKIDCLINNAAISSFSLFTDITLDEWNEMISVNLTGAFLYTREVSRRMIREKAGRIINISSMWGIVGSSCEVHYSTAKAGLIGMTKALAKELGPSGITVNAIAPGLINTDMNKSLDADAIKAIEDETPLMRVGEPCDVAAAALFLASDEASFITGQVINVSGGFVIT
ncbi:MAG: 3-oxoacyl-ACP reductase FabG [Clostridia bacterium]|nr:3-oxoacyl-ACP reductase FabG [Clostridia bacterium]